MAGEKEEEEEGFLVIDLTAEEKKGEKTEESPPALVDGDDCELEAKAAQRSLVELRRKVGAGEEWTDPEFPATIKSIEGKELKTEEKKKVQSSTGRRPKCGCGADAAEARVKADTANHGRRYWHCPSRSCGFFEWADGMPSQSSRRSKCVWKRYEAPLVTDDGFRAGDLRQGSLGTCWFLSALAVVAERHDLVARLFVDTAPHRTQAYGIRFFLDGQWTSVWVDGLIPSLPPRKIGPAKQDTASLRPAFARTSAPDGRFTLWGSLTEKAYAKAHGSFAAISGGQISEALRDLTGAATVSVDLPRTGDFGFLDSVWHHLVEWKTKWNLPMGCATSESTEGLSGHHAYSILAVKEYPEGRLLRVRDPHGLSRFPQIEACGTQAAARLASQCHTSSLDVHDRALIEAASLGLGGPRPVGEERGGDGTFFVPYHHFAAAFCRVDVALAFMPGTLCARSLRCAFPAPKARSRLCEGPVALTSRGSKTTVALAVVQDAKRGSWCRADRKKSYQPGDVSLVIVDENTRQVLASCLRGVEVGNQDASCVFSLDPFRSCLVFSYSLGKNPSAGGSKTATPPFVLRVTADAPLALRRVGTTESDAPARALHAVLAARAHTAEVVSRHFSRRSFKVSSQVEVSTYQCDGMVVIVITNAGLSAVIVNLVAYCKSAVCRIDDAGGVLADDAQAAQAYADRLAQFSDNNKKPTGYRWPAKWKCFKAAGVRVPAERRRIALVVARTGVQFSMGDVECTIADHGGGAGPKRIQATLSSGYAPIFGPVPLDILENHGTADLQRALDASRREASEKADLQRALDMSRQNASEDADLQRALDMSRQNASEHADLQRALDMSRQNASENADLQRALELSRRHAQPPQKSGDVIVIDDDDDDDVIVLDAPPPPKKPRRDDAQNAVLDSVPTKEPPREPIVIDDREDDAPEPTTKKQEVHEDNDGPEARRKAALAALQRRGLL